VGIVALVALVVEIGLSIAATTHSSNPKRVVHVTAGPYALTVNLYDNPANAGFALPFAIAPQQPVNGHLTFNVSSISGKAVHATPVRASIGPDANVPGGIQGDAEITVQGPWVLHIVVDGAAGHGVVDVPITATAPPAIPGWIGWSIGAIALIGLLVFLLLQPGRKRMESQVVGAQ
jgi:hypothetical protein